MILKYDTSAILNNFQRIVTSVVQKISYLHFYIHICIHSKCLECAARLHLRQLLTKQPTKNKVNVVAGINAYISILGLR